MSATNNSPVLNPISHILRDFTDGTIPPTASLAETRVRMSELDQHLVSNFAERYMLAVGAVIFKASLVEVQAVERQAENIQNAVSSARLILPGNKEFPKLIGNLWNHVVPMHVACQENAFLYRSKPRIT